MYKRQQFGPFHTPPSLCPLPDRPIGCNLRGGAIVQIAQLKLLPRLPLSLIHISCLEARKHYAWYLKGVPYAGYWKSEISKISTLADVYRVTAGIKRELKDASDDG